MQSSNAYNGYNAYKNNSVNYASKEQLLLMLVEGAVKFAKIGRQAIIDKDIKKAHDNLITLKSWLNIFKGVATKYLNNYLAWFKTLLDICGSNKEFLYTSFLELIQF